jgi:threonine/homoserine/homoserine lactone efflux protein
MNLETFFQYLLQGMVLGLPAAATPGPFQTYLINQSLAKGWRQAATLAFIPLISDIPAVLTITILLNRLPENFLQIISIIGGLFVLYMAWGLWRQWRTQGVNDTLVTTNTHWGDGAYWRGLLMNLLSPGLYAFWALVSGPILVSALQESWIYGAAFLVGFYCTLIGGFLGIMIIFDQAHRLGSRFVRILMLISIIVLILFGVFMLSKGVI